MLRVYTLSILFFLCFPSLRVLSQQPRPITGTIVTANNGEAVTGATIRSLRSPQNGAVSDVSGNFSLSTFSDDTLEVAFIGYRTARVPVAGRSALEVTLSEDGKMIEETVITAFGIERQARSVGFATQNLKGEELMKSNTANNHRS